MGLCDLSAASPVLSALLGRKIQTADVYEQLGIMNSDIMAWLGRISSDR